MTTSRYLFARIALAFGIHRRQRRMAEAAAETHLLREAEQVLGQRVWENVEEVEELGIEYWNLRRLSTERERLRGELEKSEAILTSAHEQRATLLSGKSNVQEQFEKDRRQLIFSLEGLAKDRDAIVNQAREMRRLYDGLKTKLEVLKEENREDAEVVLKTKDRMGELRKKFESLKGDRDRIAHEISSHDEELQVIDRKLDAERKVDRTEASEAFQQIGDANRAISECKAELGVIETRMQQLFGEIGRHISRYAATDAECRNASRGNRQMIDVMGALRKSIALNHKLAGV